MITKREISYSERLKPGDRLTVELRPRADLGKTVTAYLLSGNIYRIGLTHPEFSVERWDYLDDNALSVDIVVNNTNTPQLVQASVITPAVIVAALVGISVIAISATVWKITDTVEETIDTPGGQALAYSVPMIAIVGIIVALYFWFKKK